MRTDRGPDHAPIRNRHMDRDSSECLRTGGVAPSWEQALLAVTLSAPRVQRVACVEPPASGDFEASSSPPLDRSRRRSRDDCHGWRACEATDQGHCSKPISRCGSVPTVTAARAIVDLSVELARPEFGRLLDDAIRRRPHHARGLPAVRRTVGARTRTLDPQGQPRPREPTARLLAWRQRPRDSRPACAGPGRAPASPAAVPDDARGAKVRIDLAYPEHRIAIELDGWEYHGIPLRIRRRPLSIR